MNISSYIRRTKRVGVVEHLSVMCDVTIRTKRFEQYWNAHTFEFAGWVLFPGLASWIQVVCVRLLLLWQLCPLPTLEGCVKIGNSGCVTRGVYRDSASFCVSRIIVCCEGPALAFVIAVDHSCCYYAATYSAFRSMHVVQCTFGIVPCFWKNCLCCLEIFFFFVLTASVPQLHFMYCFLQLEIIAQSDLFALPHMPHSFAL